MADTTSAVVINGTKRINELTALNKISGKEEVIVDDGNLSYRVSVDSLMGYIANQINSGTFDPSTIQTSSGIVVIPETETLPAESRVAGNMYLNVISSTEAKVTAGTTQRIKVSPNMGLKIVAD